MRYKVFIIFAIIFLALPVRADETSDKIADLHRKIEELTKQAAQYRGTVLEKQKETNTLKRQIDILTNQILRLETDIRITDNRIESAGIELTDLEGKLFETQKDIDFQNNAIGATINYLNDRDQSNIVQTLFGANSIAEVANQAQQTLTLHEKLNDLLKNLKERKIALQDQKTGVEQKKKELERLNNQQEQQKQSLGGNKSTKAQLLKETKGQESRYQQLLNEAEQQKAKFFADLQSLESNAVANGTVITHVTATAVPARGTKIFVKPYHDEFYETQGYGMTTYAKRGAYGGAAHNGRDMASGCASPIYAIGAGTVLASGFNSGFGNWIAVKHDAGGGMVSLSAHMVRGTTLPNGTRVETNTVLGYEGTTGTSTGCHLHLSLYRDFFTYINAKNNQLYFNYYDGSVNPADFM